MSPSSATFCDEINDSGRVIVNAGIEDLKTLFERIRRTGQFSFSLARTSDSDCCLEFISTPEGMAIVGSEDSHRGNFAYYFFDPAKTAELTTIDIHEVPEHAVCDHLDDALEIAELFFKQGELDRRFSWMVDVRVGSSAKRSNLLAAGNQSPIEALWNDRPTSQDYPPEF